MAAAPHHATRLARPHRRAYLNHMSFWAPLFWCALFASVVWGAMMLVGLGISETYHPMAARGDLFHWVRFGGLVLSILTAIVFFGMWSRQAPLPNRRYKIGLGIVAVAMALPFLPHVDSGYRQVYWLGETPYEIPWQ